MALSGANSKSTSSALSLFRFLSPRAAESTGENCPSQYDDGKPHRSTLLGLVLEVDPDAWFPVILIGMLKGWWRVRVRLLRNSLRETIWRICNLTTEESLKMQS